MSLVHLGSTPPATPPLDPSAQNARDQLAHELSKAQYAAAQPSPLQVIVQKIEDWFNSILGHTGGSIAGAPGLIFVVIIAVVIAAVIVGFLVFGLPRINRRSAIGGAMFGDEDDRDAGALRREAEVAASNGDFATAIEEGFRAIARGLAERVIVTAFPGTTAHSFALDSADAFPDLRTELARCADAFDGVRYLGRPGTETEWLAVAALESTLRSSRPAVPASADHERVTTGA